jgi:multidrug efflux pump
MWWKQLATAVVFGLGTATFLTLLLTPSLLAARVWLSQGVGACVRAARAWAGGPEGRTARDDALRRAARQAPAEDVVWTETAEDLPPLKAAPPPRAAE